MRSPLLGLALVAALLAGPTGLRAASLCVPGAVPEGACPCEADPSESVAFERLCCCGCEAVPPVDSPEPPAPERAKVALPAFDLDLAIRSEGAPVLGRGLLRIRPTPPPASSRPLFLLAHSLLI